MSIGTIFAAIGVAHNARKSYETAQQGAKARLRAGKAQQKIVQIENKQNERAFLRNFRQMQADALIQSIGAGLGFDSTLAQGTLASQSAQALTASAEMKQRMRLSEYIVQQEQFAAHKDTVQGMFESRKAIAGSFMGS
jgi:hypothetical protein